MRKLRESTGMKVIAMIVMVIALSFGVVSVIGQIRIMDALYSDLRRDGYDIFYPYEQSYEFENQVSLKIEQLSEYLWLKGFLEGNGTLDYNKSINFYQKDGIQKGYTIGELVKTSSAYLEEIPTERTLQEQEYFESQMGRSWKEEGIYTTNVFNYGNTLIDFQNPPEDILFFEDDEAAFEYYQNIYEPYHKNKRKETEESNMPLTNEEREIITETRIVEENIIDPVEWIRMNGGEWNSSYESVSNNFIENGQEELQEPIMKYYTKTDVAYHITKYMAYYQYYENLFEKNPTNLYYQISCGEIFETNMEEEKFIHQQNKIGEISYHSGDYMVNTQMSISNYRKYIGDIENTLIKRRGGQEECTISIQVYADPLIKDRIGTGACYHEMKMKLAVIFPVVAIVSGILLLVSSIYLLLAAGHKKGVDGIYLIWFDRWYTEIAALALTVLFFIFLQIAYENLYYSYYYDQKLALIMRISMGVIFPVIGAMVVTFFGIGSLVRRCKAHTFWKNSLCYTLFHLLKVGMRAGIKHIRFVLSSGNLGLRIFGTYGIVLGMILFSVLFNYILGVKSGYYHFFFVFLNSIGLTGLMGILAWKRYEQEKEAQEILEGTECIARGEMNYKMQEGDFHGSHMYLARAINHIGDGFAKAVEQSIKDERMKTDLITNVSHDIKTPLTSIINYVDLLKREKIEDKKVQGYIDVLDIKSQRLKNLTDDLVEASKLSSGTVVIAMEQIDLVELVKQTLGEFEEKFILKDLITMPTLPEKSIYIEAEGRRMWRILENLCNNVAKYAMPHTRVYISVEEKNSMVEFVMKNISENPLNISSEELTERFIRGDVSRSTEGSGLGLSIAKSLTELMNGSFAIYMDGDLFRVTLIFPVKKDSSSRITIQNSESPFIEKEYDNIQPIMTQENQKNAEDWDVLEHVEGEVVDF